MNNELNCWFLNLFKFYNHECEITTKRVPRLWQTQRTSTLWWNIKNIKSKLTLPNYNEPNISLRVIWVTLLIYYVFRVGMSVTIAALKRCSIRLFLQLLVRGLICGICVCVHIVVSSTYVFGFFSFCVPYVASFSGWYIFSCPFVIVIPVTYRSVS